MRPAHVITGGLVLAFALGVAVTFIAMLLPLTPSDAPIPMHVSARRTEFEPPHPSEPRVSSQAEPWSDAPLPSFGEGTGPGILLERRCLAIAEHDPFAAMKMAVANHLQEVDSGLSASLIAQWAKQDFERAYEWTKAQEAGTWRDDMLARLAYLRAVADPKAAARLVAVDMTAGPAQDEAAISVIHQWALRDAQGATRWAESLPDQALRQRAFDEITGLATSPFSR